MFCNVHARRPCGQKASLPPPPPSQTCRKPPPPLASATTDARRRPASGDPRPRRYACARTACPTRMSSPNPAAAACSAGSRLTAACACVCFAKPLCARASAVAGGTLTAASALGARTAPTRRARPSNPPKSPRPSAHALGISALRLLLLPALRSSWRLPSRTRLLLHAASRHPSLSRTWSQAARTRPCQARGHRAHSSPTAPPPVDPRR